MLSDIEISQSAKIEKLIKLLKSYQLMKNI